MNTPRTDAAIIAADGRWTYDLKEEMQRMERELNAANERIRRLEEAGSLALGYAAKGDLESADAVWNKAKDIKP